MVLHIFGTLYVPDAFTTRSGAVTLHGRCCQVGRSCMKNRKTDWIIQHTAAKLSQKTVSYMAYEPSTRHY